MLVAGGILEPGVKVRIKPGASLIGRMINQQVGYKDGEILRAHPTMMDAIIVEWPDGNIFSVLAFDLELAPLFGDGDYESI